MFNNKVLKVLSILIGFLSVSMLPSILWSLYYSEHNEAYSLFYSSLIAFVFAIFLFLFSRFVPKNKNDITSVDAFTIVSIGWLLTGFFGSFPYYLSHNDLSFVDCFFESMSGFTTTGATILGTNSVEIESLGYGLLFWRSFTQFLGGMGIIVFSIALLPLLGIGGVQLFKAEVAGPTADKITPRIKQTAKLLWGIYVGLTFLVFILFYIQGMSLFDSICHSFTTISTAGFSTHSESIKFFNNPGIEWTMIFFMFVAGTNFTIHYFLLANGRFDYFKNEEFKTYFIVYLVIILLVFINIATSNIDNYDFNFETIRHAMFTTTSLITTSGFVTENYEIWPNLSVALCFFLFFLGASAGSTTGGLKIVRTLLVFKYLYFEIKRLIHPNVVYNIKIGNKIVSSDIVKNTLGFYLFYILIFVLFTLFISFYNIDLVSAISISASSIGNIGPGLGSIGPYDNWGHLPNIIKIFSTLCMLLGRLEIFTVVVVISRIFWK